MPPISTEGTAPSHAATAPDSNSPSVQDAAAMGVRRISVGGTLARIAMNAFLNSAREIAAQGTFDSFSGVMTNAELNTFFDEDRKRRPRP